MENQAFREDFYEAIEKKDIPYLRAYIAAKIRNDQKFERNACDDCMRFLKEKGLDITEKFKLNVSEKEAPTDQALWTEKLFYDKVEYLRLNFAYDERVPELREIGRTVYGKEKSEKGSNLSAETSRKNMTASKTVEESQRGSRQTSPFAIVGAIAAIVAIIGLIVFLLKK